MKKVSVIIPCFNQYEFIMDAISSVVNQTYWRRGSEHSPSIEIIVVDDHSDPFDYEKGINPDDRIWLQHYEHIKFIHHETNKGLSAARNTGIKAATGDYILPLDADDKIHETCIEKMVEASAHLDIISSYLETFGDYVRQSKPPLRVSYSDLRLANRINCCSLFTKVMWENIGGYDDKMLLGYEDWRFWLDAAKKGYSIGTIPEVLFYYRKHGETMLTRAKNRRSEIIQYIKQFH